MTLGKCVNCGKCCDFIARGHQPFITAADMRVWLDKGLWAIIRHVRFTLGGTKEKPHQEWSFEHPEDEKGTCYFRQRGKCAIYSVRPLACAVYPLRKNCASGELGPNTNKHLQRLFVKAAKEWGRSGDQWRQDKLKELLTEAGVKFGEPIGDAGAVPLETVEHAKARETLIGQG